MENTTVIWIYACKYLQKADCFDFGIRRRWDMRSTCFRQSILWTAVLLSRLCLSFRHEPVSSTTLEHGDESLLEVFQVYPPPLSPEDLVGSTECSFTLMNHVFADSAGKPYIGAI